MRTDPLTGVLSRLAPEQRQAITDRFTATNPHWDGAMAGDILEALYDQDANLAEREPFAEANPELAGKPGAGYAVLALIWSGQEVTPEGVAALIGEASPPARCDRGSDREAGWCEQPSDYTVSRPDLDIPTQAESCAAHLDRTVAELTDGDGIAPVVRPRADGAPSEEASR
jgi:hypothetical protein